MSKGCIRRLLGRLAVMLGVLSVSAVAAEAAAPRSFAPGSLARIVAERQGKPFVLAFWSVGCTHCPTELRSLSALKRRHPALDVVLVATDGPDEAPLAARLAAEFGLAGAPQWIFDESGPERLRYEIDRRWYGELPRTYLYDRKHVVEAHSGLIPQERLARWVRENVR